MSIASNSIDFQQTPRRLDDFDNKVNGDLGQFKVTCSEVNKDTSITYGCEHPDERSKLDKFKSWINHTFLNRMESRDVLKKLASYDMGQMIRDDVGERFPHLSDNLKNDLTDHLITNGTNGKITYSQTDLCDRPRIHHHTRFGHAFNSEDLSRINDMMDKYAKVGVPFSLLQTSEARHRDLMQRDETNQLSPAYVANMTTHAKSTQV